MDIVAKDSKKLVSPKLIRNSSYSETENELRNAKEEIKRLKDMNDDLVKKNESLNEEVISQRNRIFKLEKVNVAVEIQ